MTTWMFLNPNQSPTINLAYSAKKEDNKLSPNKPNSLKKEMNVGGQVYSTLYIHNNTTT